MSDKTHNNDKPQFDTGTRPVLAGAALIQAGVLTLRAEGEELTVKAPAKFLRALFHWCDGSKTRAELADMQLEIRCANLYFTFFPIFAASLNDRLVHIEDLADSAIAFGGWRPYKPYSTRLSTEKLLFKQHLSEAGVRTPQLWPPGQQPSLGYIRKKSRGSFGYDIQGPFQATVPVLPPGPGGQDAA